MPLRPANVPESAFYVEGAKAGYWYMVHSVSDHRNQAYISVFEGKTGRLLSKKCFTLICRTDNLYFIDDLKKQIQDFREGKIYLKPPNDKEGCSLWGLESTSY